MAQTVTFATPPGRATVATPVYVGGVFAAQWTRALPSPRDGQEPILFSVGRLAVPALLLEDDGGRRLCFSHADELLHLQQHLCLAGLGDWLEIPPVFEVEPLIGDNHAL